ncbi:hypothetical protein OOK13_29590 [Streptomyces sp. NBC_00378]|uniref:hypothetical protein n=1 Tax=unclassified Streptomyces TaxID=2593676 RepID=UPI00225318E1|nr:MULTISPECIES: hypothetical protein [unclassified Streptomyces]MCX5112553.1 hypothetical protein [Streptomyces sp. NBC_00378]
MPRSPSWVCSASGSTRSPTSGRRRTQPPSAVSRPLQHLDIDALDAAIASYLQAGTPPPQKSEPPPKPALPAVAVDGRTVRVS